MENKMQQKTGDNSTNLQANGNIILQQGISEERVRAIFDEKMQCAIAQLSSEAQLIATNRNSKFLNKLVSRMMETNSMEAFLDPDFQFLLIDAQKSASSSDRDTDINLLSELLVHRFKKQKDRSAKIGIVKAVNIVHQIPDDALQGLTILHTVGTFFPTTGNIKDGLDILNNLFQKIIYDNLPFDSRWLDDLDILGAVRISNFGSMKKIEQYYPKRLCGYVCEGIAVNSNEHTEVVRLLKENRIPPVNILVKHELSDNHLRLNIVNKSVIDTLIFHIEKDNDNIPFSDTQKQVITTIAENYCRIDAQHQATIDSFMKLLDNYPHLKTLKDWWNNLNKFIEITSVGRVLAHANAQRCDNTLPALD
ncbi:MAG: hypothetical protein MdMp024_1664 [Bacteroidales bacterium]